MSDISMDDFQALVDDAVAWRKWSALHPLVKAKMLRDEGKELSKANRVEQVLVEWEAELASVGIRGFNERALIDAVRTANKSEQNLLDKGK